MRSDAGGGSDLLEEAAQVRVFGGERRDLSCVGALPLHELCDLRRRRRRATKSGILRWLVGLAAKESNRKRIWQRDEWAGSRRSYQAEKSILVIDGRWIWRLGSAD